MEVNPFFSVEEWPLAPDCRGRRHTDRVTGEARLPELSDGTRWYAVPQEVFDLWLRAYELGRQRGRQDALERFED